MRWIRRHPWRCCRQCSCHQGSEHQREAITRACGTAQARGPCAVGANPRSGAGIAVYRANRPDRPAVFRELSHKMEKNPGGIGIAAENLSPAKVRASLRRHLARPVVHPEQELHGIDLVVVDSDEFGPGGRRTWPDQRRRCAVGGCAAGDAEQRIADRLAVAAAHHEAESVDRRPIASSTR